MPSDVEILLNECATLRAEVLDRIRIAFSHLGYAGAVIAFAFPASDKFSTHPWAALGLAALGAVILGYISVINGVWVARIGVHLEALEKRINEAAGGKPLLSWQTKAAGISRWVLFPPRPY